MFLTRASVRARRAARRASRAARARPPLAAMCPNACSGNGICMTIEDLGKMYGPDYIHPERGGDGVGPTYGNWDRSSVTVCNCDPGFFGPDCSRIHLLRPRQHPPLCHCRLFCCRRGRSPRVRLRP